MACVSASAEAVAYDLVEYGDWGPDLAVGLTLVGTGAATLRHNRETGWLLLAAVLAWFAGTAVPSLLHLHRGPLVHLLFVVPARRRSRAAIAGVIVGYVAAVVPGVWSADLSAVGVAGARVVVAGVGVVSDRGRGDPAQWFSLLGTALFGFSVVGGTVARALFGGGEVIQLALLWYSATVAATWRSGATD